MLEARPCPVPRQAGVYGWYFRDIPCKTNTSGCVRFGDLTLLYVGISPAAPPRNGSRPSEQTIRSRLQTHYRGNASRSTLRMSLGVLLGLRLGATGSGRLNFGDHEPCLDKWMANNAFVTWAMTAEQWEAEHELINTLDVPLNLDGNSHHAFRPELSRLRREAREAARGSGPRPA
ncbi:MAG: GIY-YIG nuclease family protein [Dehalococcoidia bacterium]